MKNSNKPPEHFREYLPSVYVGPMRREHQIVYVCWTVGDEDPDNLTGWVHVTWPGGAKAYLPITHVRPMRPLEWYDETAEARKQAVIDLSKIVSRLASFMNPNADQEAQAREAMGLLLSSFTAFEAEEILRIAAISLADASASHEASVVESLANDLVPVRQPESLPT